MHMIVRGSPVLSGAGNADLVPVSCCFGDGGSPGPARPISTFQKKPIAFPSRARARLSRTSRKRGDRPLTISVGPGSKTDQTSNRRSLALRSQVILIRFHFPRLASFPPLVLFWWRSMSRPCHPHPTPSGAPSPLPLLLLKISSSSSSPHGGS